MRLTRKWIVEFFKKNWKDYYRTIELNEKLYFHYKGFRKIACMELFPDLKCLYFEGNGLEKISGLTTNTQLMSLFLQENVIEKMEGLDFCTRLRTLNLSNCCIRKIEGLRTLEVLDSLYLKQNRIGKDGLDDVIGLLECPSLQCVELHSNCIDEPAIVEEVFLKMPVLKVIYLHNNEITKKIPNYRKTVIAKLPTLTYLDDRPVFEDDRRNAEAFHRGGWDAERAERDVIKKEKEAEREKYHLNFKAMMDRAK